MKRVRRLVHHQTEWLGKGSVVAVLDTGVARHPDLNGRIWKFHDFVNGRLDMYDDNGHGTHVCGIIAGARYGVAPESRIIALKVLDETGNGQVEYSMRAFRWIIENREKYNIRIVNISMGMKPNTNEEGERYILAGVETLWNMGLIVIAAAGNLGPAPGSITIPGVHKKIITVGCYDKVHSGRGDFGKHMMKPDLVAPGSNIYSCNAFWSGDDRRRYIMKSGTSMSTPIVTGAVANMLSKYVNITNTEAKRRLVSSCRDMGLPRNWQGNGMLDMKACLK